MGESPIAARIMSISILAAALIVTALILFMLFRRLRFRLQQPDAWIGIVSLIASYVLWPDSYHAIVGLVADQAVNVWHYLTEPVIRAFYCQEDEDCSRTMLAYYAGKDMLQIPVTEVRIDAAPLPAQSLGLLVSGPLGATVIALVIHFVRSRIGVATSAAALVQKPISLAFLSIVLFSFYLCLMALLTIPLISKEPLPPDFGYEDLEARLTTILGTAEDFKNRYPSIVVSNASPGLSAAPTIGSTPSTNIGPRTGKMKADVNSSVSRTNRLRDTTYLRLQDSINQATAVFRAQSVVGLGGPEAVSHFSDLEVWFIEQKTKQEGVLETCLNAVNTYALLAGVDPDQTGDEIESRDWDLEEAEFDAEYQCTPAISAVSVSPVPQRKSRASTLPIIGGWSGWLINSESMPLTVIVGLVGFSFLGASLSRVVRAGTGPTQTWLGMEDLVVVVISGATAALAVFVAAYGGLAVISQADIGADPNPYVVFTLCLAAAIYSEDVWEWLHNKFLHQLRREGEQEMEKQTIAQKDSGPAAPPVAARVLTGGYVYLVVSQSR